MTTSSALLPTPDQGALPQPSAGRLSRATPAALLVGAVAAALGTAGVVSLSDGGGVSAPITPRGTVEAFLATGLSGDYAAQWDLMCREEQRALGPRDEYVEERATRAKTVDREGLFHVDVRRVRPAEPPHEGGYVVELLFSHPEMLAFFEDVLVIWEDGGLRVCGQP